MSIKTLNLGGKKRRKKRGKKSIKIFNLGKNPMEINWEKVYPDFQFKHSFAFAFPRTQGKDPRCNSLCRELSLWELPPSSGITPLCWHSHGGSKPGASKE